MLLLLITIGSLAFVIFPILCIALDNNTQSHSDYVKELIVERNRTAFIRNKELIKRLDQISKRLKQNNE